MFGLPSSRLPASPALPEELSCAAQALTAALTRAVDEADPYPPGSRQRILSRLQAESVWNRLPELWQSVQALFPGTAPELCCRYALACFPQPVSRWILFSAAFCRKAVTPSQALELCRLAYGNSAEVEEFLLDASRDLIGSARPYGLPDAAGLRWQLAGLWRKPGPVRIPQVVEACARTSSDFKYWFGAHASQLEGFIGRVLGEGRKVAALTPGQAKRIVGTVPDRLLALAAFQKLWNAQPQRAHGPQTAAYALAMKRGTFLVLRRALLARDFAKANRQAAKLAGLPEDITREDVSIAGLDGLRLAWSETSFAPDLADITPLTDQAGRFAGSVLGCEAPAWCFLPVGRMASRLRFSSELESMPESMRRQLANAYIETHPQKLAPGQGDMHWLTAKSFECPEWEDLCALQTSTPTPELLQAMANTRQRRAVKEAMRYLRLFRDRNYENCVTRFMGTELWRKAGGVRLHQDLAEDLEKFLGMPGAVLSAPERQRFAAAAILDADDREELAENFSRLIGSRVPAEFVLEHVCAGGGKDAVQLLLDSAPDSIRRRYVIDFIGTELWERAGGASLHEDFAQDLAQALASPSRQLAESELCRMALRMADEQHDTSLVAAVLPALTRSDKIWAAAEQGVGTPLLVEAVRAIDESDILNRVLSFAKQPDIELAAHDALLQFLMFDEEILEEHLWRAEHRCSAKRLPECETTLAQLTAIAIREHGNLRRMARLLPAHAEKCGLKGRQAEGLVAQALRSAARLVSRHGRLRAAALELLSCIGLECATALKYVLANLDRKAGSGRELDHVYHLWELPKKSGGKRTICAPPMPLKIVQRAILHRLLEPLGAHKAAYGFVPGRSIGQNAALHVGSEVVANTDISSCFPSVRWQLVLGVLRRDLGKTLLSGTVSLVTDICTGQGGLPTGAPTSPAILNRALLKTDEILTAAAARRGCTYSRYADDLTFSGGRGAVEMLGVARSTLERIGLKLDPKKTNIFRRGRRQTCTGLVVNDKVAVPRAIRRRLRAAVHAVEQGREPTWHGREDTAAALGGRLNFLASVQPEKAAPLKERLARALHGGKDR